MLGFSSAYGDRKKVEPLLKVATDGENKMPPIVDFADICLVIIKYFIIFKRQTTLFHNTLHRLERNQKYCLTILGIIFLIASLFWLASEIFNWKLPLEPAVVFIGGTATLLATFWPWKPGYADRRIKGRVTCDYMSNNSIFIIGNKDLKFTLQFSKASDTSIHLYSDPMDIDSIALLASDTAKISDVRDVSSLDYSNRSVTAQEGQLVAMRNTKGNYAIIHIIDVRDSSRSDDRDELTFSFEINPEGGTNFS